MGSGSSAERVPPRDPFYPAELKEALKPRSLEDIFEVMQNNAGDEREKQGELPEAWFILTYHFLFYTLMREHTVSAFARDFYKLLTEEEVMDGLDGLEPQSMENFGRYYMQRAEQRTVRWDERQRRVVPSTDAPNLIAVQKLFDTHYININRALRRVLFDYRGYIRTRGSRVSRVKAYLRALPQNSNWNKIVESLQDQYREIRLRPYYQWLPNGGIVLVGYH